MRGEHMNIPRPLNAHEQYLYAINVKLDTLIELLSKQHDAPAPAARKRTTKKEG